MNNLLFLIFFFCLFAIFHICHYISSVSRIELLECFGDMLDADVVKLEDLTDVQDAESSSEKAVDVEHRNVMESTEKAAAAAAKPSEEVPCNLPAPAVVPNVVTSLTATSAGRQADSGKSLDSTVEDEANKVGISLFTCRIIIIIIRTFIPH